MDIDTLSILAPAFAAGLIVLLSHVPLGREVLSRGIIFIDLAIAQLAGLGIILASALGFDTHGWELQGIALLSALAGAALFGAMERRAGKHQEALIGITFVLAASAAILLLANNPHGGEHLKDLLVGQILWVEWSQLHLPLLVGSAVFLCSWLAPDRLRGKSFYFVFAIAITLSVQLVGVYLVFASLILPALSFIQLKTRPALLGGLLLGSAAYAMGLALSAWSDLPSGAVIVCVLALVALLGGSAIRPRATS